MGRRLSEQEKKELVAQYQAGKTARDLCAESGVSKSAFYEWTSRYQIIQSQSGQAFTPREFEHLKRRAEKAERR